MSTFSKSVLVGLATIAWSATGMAGLEENTRERTRPTKVESMARVTDTGPSSTLRCFQEGRLVFEGSDVELAKENKPLAVFKGKNGKSVKLIDLRHGLCILDRRDG